ncbi:MAG: cysteine synthase A [Ruminococcaceae bacterium]|nr:cysteine synthase A [Oscillospiraceae bacterium]
MKIFGCGSEVIGNTPLIRLLNIEKEYNLKAKLFAKAEFFNPTGSAKDRAAKFMVDDAEERGIISKGATIIEPTSGNTGIGLAAYAVPKGYKVVIVMPDTMSAERITLMRAYGAEVVLTQGKLGMSGAIAKAEELKNETPNSFIPDQFGNPANAKAHYETTGPEIWYDTDGNVDVFVAGVGTGGTITGTGRFLKEMKPNTEIIAVEPANSAVLSGKSASSHGLQGIGAGFIPKVLDVNIIDKIETVEDNEAFEACRKLASLEGLLAGISSGAALVAAIKTAKLSENEGKNIVVLLPDSGSRYLSSGLF